MNCEVKDCTNEAKYALYRLSIYTEEKEWLHICPEHEEEIGDRNLEVIGRLQ